ncbi:TPA: ORF6C domain-containing protein [Clostridium perfringens]|uniref:Phage antirepressor Ant n=1 Tax=Clostridium perfringens TaxID=1502 RepID=A0AAE8K7B6_CLOPF|nr:MULTISPECIES: Rha family transcriptional regulator [Clostridium]MDU2139752.1 ORF6C domain-containing protein [Streptococcus mitis]EGT0680565.1 phage antirepressor Ant [Clostridium perfringens]EHR1327328.1 ORF6C domain-containing protein [Clostridium perfringens]EHR1330461.1 ORF6C domain-containing protein [Clostridium perfringens]EHR1423938.1 ORF6C domain-containing protein [Clostridium perfringens]
MNNLMIFENKEIEGVKLSNQNGQVVVSSRLIAKDFEKQHKHVLDSIEEIKKGVAEKSADLFIESQYQHPQNKQWYKEYLMTRDGFTLLAMGFNGTKALQWKLKYIEAFNKMEQALKEQRKPTSAIDLFEAQVQAFKEVKGEVQEVKNELKEFQEDLPLIGAEPEELQKVVKRVGTNALGGYGSPAYKDKSISNKVYKNVWKFVKDQFNVNTYKAIKRKHLSKAKEIAESYKAPFYLQEKIDMLNNQSKLNI